VLNKVPRHKGICSQLSTTPYDSFIQKVHSMIFELQGE